MSLTNDIKPTFYSYIEWVWLIVSNQHSILISTAPFVWLDDDGFDKTETVDNLTYTKCGLL